MKTEKRRIGDLGENIVCRFLVKRGFLIVEQNFLRKWGEIDIIAKKEDTLHFIEVKSVTCENLDKRISFVSGETDCFRPEDNLHPWKLKRLSRVIQTYLLNYRSVSCENKKNNEEIEWQFDVAIVYLDLNVKKAKVNFMENIIL